MKERCSLLEGRDAESAAPSQRIACILTLDEVRTRWCTQEEIANSSSRRRRNMGVMEGRYCNALIKMLRLSREAPPLGAKGTVVELARLKMAAIY